MAFVNEYVSEEDIKKYDLVDIWLQAHPLDRKDGGPPPTYRFNWTIDRDRDIYLICVGGGGYDQFYTEWVLYWKGRPVTVRLKMPGEGSKSFSEQPYRIVWAMDHLFLKCSDDERQAFLQVLKEALTVYGSRGILHQVPNTTVSFKF